MDMALAFASMQGCTMLKTYSFTDHSSTQYGYDILVLQPSRTCGLFTTNVLSQSINLTIRLLLRLKSNIKPLGLSKDRKKLKRTMKVTRAMSSHLQLSKKVDHKTQDFRINS